MNVAIKVCYLTACSPLSVTYIVRWILVIVPSLSAIVTKAEAGFMLTNWGSVAVIRTSKECSPSRISSSMMVAISHAVSPLDVDIAKNVASKISGGTTVKSSPSTMSHIKIQTSNNSL